MRARPDRGRLSQVSRSTVRLPLCENTTRPRQLLSRAGLSERRFDDRQARVPTLRQARFLEYSAEA